MIAAILLLMTISQAASSCLSVIRPPGRRIIIVAMRTHGKEQRLGLRAWRRFFENCTGCRNGFFCLAHLTHYTNAWQQHYRGCSTKRELVHLMFSCCNGPKLCGIGNDKDHNDNDHESHNTQILTDGDYFQTVHTPACLA